jgi:hypothetical protein
VETEGFVLKAKVHSAKVMDFERGSRIEHNRRMSKDYERLCASGEAFVYAAMSRLMVRRLIRL